MKHLIISRELPPAPYAAGGIGTYVDNIMRLLAAEGETVHVIGQRWEGAPDRHEVRCGGRLVIHRIAPEDRPPRPLAGHARARWAEELRALRGAPFPNQWFALHAALLAERLIEEEGIDVIEGQEWEAPLYYLLLRRELGLAPARRPPCIVHLHSPSEFITRYDGQHGASAGAYAMQHMERYCIIRADAHLCPSRFLARQCEAHYGLAPNSVSVIRLPIGDLTPQVRSALTWTRGSICYVGRLEPRKGVIEWVDAAVQAAARDPNVCFDFIGADHPAGDGGLSMRAFLRQRIPPPLRPRFRFHGPQPREALPGFLARARAAVVPSRWENFPNTCIEAMGSGLPVIASRFGGMAEMVGDGETGWIADAPDQTTLAPALHEALQRCLRASPAQRQAMGEAAAAAVRTLCDNRRIVQTHIALRARVAERGAGARAETAASAPAPGVVLWVRSVHGARSALDALHAQTTPPTCLVVVGPPESAVKAEADAAGAALVALRAQSGTEAWNAGYARAARAGAAAAPGWMFLDEDDLLAPDALERLGAALAAAPDAGLVTCWSALPEGGTHVPLDPALPHLWFAPALGHATVFRATALPPGEPFAPAAGAGLERWELAVGVLALGWRGLTYPALLARRARDPLPGVLPWETLVAFRERRAALVRRHPEALARAAHLITEVFVPLDARTLPPPPPRPRGRREAWRRRAARLRRRAARWLARLQGGVAPARTLREESAP
ncbi:glycosyltransferase family 4 protein [Ectothiorhodospiraceae bacterium 2226]|nr:glycosyltransferase family 4 protein [Ectothiorhodospiraceae bacterium 2226]